MRIASLVIALLLIASPLAAQTQSYDKKKAQRTLKQSKCFNCHSVTREKDGPSFQSVSEKYKDHPDARHVLFDHLTKSPTITVKGKEEAHTSFKTSDTAEINNVVEWILSN
ncbi:MAG: c-type cytochrome [Gammaproteobacteria bacterium]|jgi:cytochrome c551/c552|nr:c-type cytochrome [Gammaproteobacteria bacterium]